MFVKAVLIIDKRKEQTVKYKKMLEHCGITVFTASNFPRALDILSRFEPDVLLISDSMDFDIKKSIKYIRMSLCSTRPAVIVLSKSSHIQDKIDVLDSGADDFLSEPIQSGEFTARINAHLRRNFENCICEKTMLFDSKITYKMLKRTVNSASERAFMLIGINKFEYYKELYGAIAADKLLQACAAIIKPALCESDYFGHLSNENFIVITGIEQAEKIANYIVHAFDAAAPNFYSRIDRERGFIFMRGDDAAEGRIELVSVNIGIIADKYKKYTDIKQVINSLYEVYKIAKCASGSNYAAERLKITAENASEYSENNNILIAEPDDALSLLLEASIRLQGYNARAAASFEEIPDAAAEFNPAVIILDAGDAETLKGLEVCRKLKSENIKSNIILTAAMHDKELIMSAGADVYLPKPYELSDIFVWIRKFSGSA